MVALMLSLLAMSTLLMINISCLPDVHWPVVKMSGLYIRLVDASTYTAGNSLRVSGTIVYEIAPPDYGRELTIDNRTKVLHVTDRLICRTISGSNLSHDLLSKTNKHVGMR